MRPRGQVLFGPESTKASLDIKRATCQQYPRHYDTNRDKESEKGKSTEECTQACGPTMGYVLKQRSAIALTIVDRPSLSTDNVSNHVFPWIQTKRTRRDAIYREIRYLASVDGTKTV